MNIYLGSDHRGFELKNKLKQYLKKRSHKVFDLGNTEFDSSDDYPDFGKRVALAVLEDSDSRGIVLCGSGAGICIAVNRVRGIRAVQTHDPKLARVSRADDNTNILCLGSDFLTFSQAKKVVSSWLETSFGAASRHEKRIKKLDEI